MLLSDLSSSPIYKTMKVCKCAKSCMLKYEHFGFLSKFNYEIMSPLLVRIYISIEKNVDIDKEAFDKHFIKI